MDQPVIGVPIPLEQLTRVTDFLREIDSKRDAVWAVRFAIDYWLENAAWKDLDDLVPEPEPEPEPQNHQGYNWKGLLLPPSSEIRMTYGEQTHHARVEGDDLVYDGKRTTPNAFVKAIAKGTTRNAWRDLQIKRPGDRQFRSATALREEQRARAKRTAARDGAPNEEG